MPQYNTPQLRFPEFSEAWEQKIFDDIVDVTRLAGYEYSKYWKEDENKEIIALRGYNIGKGKLELRDLSYISEELSQKLKRSRLYNGDIVYPCVGTIGNAVVIEENNKYHIQQNIAKISCKGNNSPYFITQFLMSGLGMNEVYKFNATSSQPNVLVGSLRNFKVNIPTCPEQQKIASFLSAADKKIEQLQQKTKLLEQYKKGMMQKLFSKQVRFKDDNGKPFADWEEKEYLEIAPLQRGFDLPNHKIDEGIHPVVFSNGILKTHNEYKAKAPGVVMGRSGTIGKITFIDRDYWPHNTSLWVTDFKENYPKYIYYLYLRFNFNAVSSGSTVPTLNRNDVHAKTEFIPYHAEQIKIADFLTAIDDKINAVSSQLDSAKVFKKGLLQQMIV